MIKELKIKTKFNINNYSPLFCITYLFFINSSFYFSSFPALSPVYLIFYITFPIIIYGLLKNTLKKIPHSSLIGICLVLYLVIFQFIVGGKPIAILGSAATFLFYIFGTLLFPKFSHNKVVLIANGVLFVSLMLGFVDTIYRLNLVGFNINSLLINFYDIKKQCIFYADTNSLAINTTILTFYSIYMFNLLKNKKYIVYSFLFTIITFLSCSRSAIFATIITFFILYGLKILKYLKNSKTSILNINAISLKRSFYYFNILITTIILSFVLLKIIVFLATDASFSTKIDLFEALFNFINSAPIINLLFGTGYNNGGISLYSNLSYAHTYLATYVIETGVCGYILVTTFLLSIIYKTPKTLLLFIPFFIMGISHISHTQLHPFYTVLALMWYFENFYKKERKYK